MAHRDCNRLSTIVFYRATNMAWLCWARFFFSVWIWIRCHFLRILLGRDRRHETKALQVWSKGVCGHLFPDNCGFIDSISGWESGCELNQPPP